MELMIQKHVIVKKWVRNNDINLTIIYNMESKLIISIMRFGCIKQINDGMYIRSTDYKFIIV